MGSFTNDCERWYEDFEKLTLKEMEKSFKKAVNKTVIFVQKNIKSELKSKIKNSNKKRKYNDTLISGVRKSKVRVSKAGNIISSVTIDSNNKTGSGSFRLRILERGSYKVGERYYKTKKNNVIHKTGKLKGFYFKDSGEKKSEGAVNSELSKALNEAVRNINNSK